MSSSMAPKTCMHACMHVFIYGTEDIVDVLIGVKVRREAERSHGAAELVHVDGVVAVAVKLLEEIDDLTWKRGSEREREVRGER